MSNNDSSDWVDSPGSSEVPGETDQGADAPTSGAPTGGETSFPRRSTEEVERDATSTRRRGSSLTDKLSQLSTSELEAGKPEQPPPKKPHISAFPEQFPHEPGHDRTKKPMTHLPDYHDPGSMRGPGIPRNPVADQWRDGAYEDWLAGAGLIFDVERRQDRWRCEYCGHFNERGVTKPEAEEPQRQSAVDSADANDPRIGAAGPSTAPPGPATLPTPSTSDRFVSSTTSPPQQIPGLEPSGVVDGELVQCAHCKENINLPHPEPRELEEAGRYVKVVVEHMKMPEELQRYYREAWGMQAKRKVLDRWRDDLLREEKEKADKDEERKKKEREDDEEAK